MGPAALALASALCWGVADFLGGVKSRGLPVAAVAVVGQLTGATLGLGIVVVCAIPLSAGRVLIFGALAGAVNLIGLLAFYRALAVGRMRVVAPIAGLGVLVPVTVGLLGGEQPRAAQAVGMLIAVAGVTLATRGDDDDAPRAPRLSVALAIVGALGIGGNLAFIEAAARHAPASSVVWAVVLSRSTAVLLLLGGALAGRAPLRGPTRADLPSLLSLGASDLLANICYGFAARASLLSLAAVLASLHPAFTVVLANKLLSESLRLGQRLGVALAIVGASLLLIGGSAG